MKPNTDWKIEGGKLIVEKGASLTVSQLAEILAEMLESSKSEHETDEERKKREAAVMVQMAAAVACAM